MTYIHPNKPPKLVAAFKKAGSYHALAEEIKVNVWFIHRLMAQGIEPGDRTPKSREIRRRMFMTKYKRRNRKRAPQTPMQKAIRAMAKETRKAIQS